MNRKKIGCGTILIIIVLLWGSFFATDFIRAKNNQKPIFAPETSFYSDGGTCEFIGLGYKVIAYAVIDKNGGITGEFICQIGTWFLSYDENFPRYK